MTLGITGATGLIGGAVLDLALRRGHEVVAFSRDPQRAIPGCEMRAFSLDAPPDLRGCDAIIHLAGESILGFPTPARKRRVVQSRVLGTRRMVEAINASASEQPEVFVCGTGIGIYGDSGDVELTEGAPAGSGFLSETVQLWENEARQVQGSRLVLLRTSVVLAKRGGALKMMAPFFRAGLGAQIGDGRQWMSWIHLEDQARLILFAVENLDLAGPVNASAPWPVRNADFTRTLATVLRRPAFLRAPAFALAPLGGVGREVLDSKRVVPAAATDHGFGFHFPELEPALRNLLG